MCEIIIESEALMLVRPSEQYIDELQAYRQEFIDSGDSMDGTGPLRRYEDMKEYLKITKDFLSRDSIPEGSVVASQFLCVRKIDGRLVGMIQIRHYFNEFLEKYAGHIGYSVRPSERKKGYASWMLGNVKPFCRKIGLEKLLISCIDSNEGSRRTIIKNGGIYESTVYLEERDIKLERYWIDLKEKTPKSMPGIIREMSEEEITACVKLIQTSFNTVAMRYGITKENSARFTAFATDESRLNYHLNVEKRPMYVYEADGKLVGYYSLAIINENEAELNNLAVLPEYRHLEIGEKLLKDSFERVKEKGIKKVKIGIVEENELLKNWYEGYGFNHTGTVKYDFFSFTCGYMEKEIQ